jgi:hypothetical protein
LVYIDITCAVGRTKELKHALYASTAEEISEGVNISSNDGFIMLNEILL